MAAPLDVAPADRVAVCRERVASLDFFTRAGATARLMVGSSSVFRFAKIAVSLTVSQLIK